MRTTPRERRVLCMIAGIIPMEYTADVQKTVEKLRGKGMMMPAPGLMLTPAGKRESELGLSSALGRERIKT